MSSAKNRKSATKEAKPSPKPEAMSAPTPIPGRVPPLYRPVDWLTFGITTLVVLVGYLLTVAPDLSLEDSGELAVASLYAGIPHPPGYPVWTIYTWVFANFIPFSNIAWRVAVSSAVAGALSCGLIGLMVSRGSSMMIEGISDLKNIERRLENMICVVAGFVAGGLLAFNGFMWSQSVIVEVYSLSVLSLVGVLVCLLRWIYAPHQRRYLYLAFFIFGICFTNHQTLILAAMGIEVAIALADYKLGRSFFLWNSILFLAGMVLESAGLIFTNTSPAILLMFNMVGVLSIAAYIWLALVTHETFDEFCRDAALLATVILFTASTTKFGKAGVFLGILSLVWFIYLLIKTHRLGWEWLTSLLCGIVFWPAGVSLYLYMALAGATNPPMQWGYPRIVEGFWHALSRGQYEKANPTNIFEDPLRFINQLQGVAEGIMSEFSWVLPLLALIPFLLLFRMQKRERAWIIGLFAMYVGMAILLVILLNPSADRASSDLNRVFFTASHVFIAMLVGYGLTLLAAMGLARPDAIRKWLPVAVPAIVITSLDTVFSVVFEMHGLGVPAEGIRSVVYGLLFAVTAGLLLRRHSEGRTGILIAAGVLAAMGLFAGVNGVMAMMSHDVSLSVAVTTLMEGFGYVLSNGDATRKVYGGLLVAAVACATLILLWRPLQGRRFIALIVVFAFIPGYSALSHWFDNEQRGHVFGYYFGHDMFTPPFKDADGQLSYDREVRAQMMENPEQAKLIYPEMARDAILFGGTDPGRFCPTYMIFCESFIPPRCKPMDPEFDRRDVYIITQNALADGTYLHYIRAHYNKSEQRKYDMPFFQEILRSSDERSKNYTTNAIARAAYTILDRPLLSLGEKIEADRRERGVYPPNEIYIPSPQDSSRSFEEYLKDAQIRMQQNKLKPGEVVTAVNNRVQVSGQVAVMAINGLLTKVIFDNNPTNEFYVEESFPLDWMFPHLTPFGVIMKINREPQPTLSEEVLARDHEFWSDFSTRLIGNWITYDTPVQEIADFAVRTYLRHELDGFEGDRKFVRDGQAQKAFSKLRSSIGGVYAWRLGPDAGAYAPKTLEERQRIIKEADFAFRQSFAFCPYSPEAVFRYVNLLLMQGRVDDARIVAETCLKLDPFNGQVKNLINQLNGFKGPNAQNPNQAVTTQPLDPQAQALELERQWEAAPGNLQIGLNLAATYMQLKQTDAAINALERVLASPSLDQTATLAVAQGFLQLGDMSRLEMTLTKLTTLMPESPEAWYDLAAIKVAVGKNQEAMVSLKKALALSAARLETDPTAKDLEAEVKKDTRLGPLQALPEFKAMVSPE